MSPTFWPGSCHVKRRRRALAARPQRLQQLAQSNEAGASRRARRADRSSPRSLATALPAAARGPTSSDGLRPRLRGSRYRAADRLIEISRTSNPSSMRKALIKRPSSRPSLVPKTLQGRAVGDRSQTSLASAGTSKRAVRPRTTGSSRCPSTTRCISSASLCAQPRLSARRRSCAFTASRMGPPSTNGRQKSACVRCDGTPSGPAARSMTSVSLKKPRLPMSR